MTTRPKKPAPAQRVTANFYPREMARIRKAAEASGLPMGRTVALLALESLDKRKETESR